MRSRDTYRVHSPIPELGAETGDVIEFDPSEKAMVLLTRRLPLSAIRILATHPGLELLVSEPLGAPGTPTQTRPALEVSEGAGKPARGRKRKPPKLEVVLAG